MKKILSFALIIVALFMVTVLDVDSIEAFATENQTTEQAAYESMIALKDTYPEGYPWTNDNYYGWKGGYYSGGYGCAGFAFMLSDAAFGTVSAEKEDSVSFSALHVGDILRIQGDTHSVIVLEVRANDVIIAEGNYNSSVHWGRTLSREEVEAATYRMTRYVQQIEKKPSLEEDGYTEKSCYLCGEIFQKTIIPAEQFYPVESITLNRNELSLEKEENAYLRATVSPSNATDKTINWTSSEPAVVSVNQNGAVTAHKPGSAIITATDGTGRISASCVVTVPGDDETPAATERTLDESKISLSFREAVYTGSAIKPSVTVSGMRNGSDYRVTYSNNVNAGTATVKIEGIGNVKGSITKNFTIKPKALEKKQITFTNRTAKIPNLVQDKDYTVTVKKEANGDTTITVKGIGNYTGEFTETYIATMALDPQAVKLQYTETVYDGTYQKPKVTVTGLKENTDYNVKYANNLKAGTASVTVTGTGRCSGKVVKNFTIQKREIKAADVTLKAVGTSGKGAATVKGLKESTDYTATYYYLSQTGEIRVRIEGIGSCTGTVRKSVFVTGYTIVPQMFFVTPTSFTYSGKECRPEVSIGTLVENVDYKVSYQDNINA